MFPIPILTRDIPGYLITPHTDTSWKGITVQLYLPEDANNTDIGTIFHEVLPDGSMPKHTRCAFARTRLCLLPSAPTPGIPLTSAQPGENPRSILLTYFVDQGLLRFLRNRGKRLGNFAHEFRQPVLATLNLLTLLRHLGAPWSPTAAATPF